MSRQNENSKLGWNFQNTYQNLPEIFYEKIHPKIAKNPKLIILNDRIAAELGLNIKTLQSEVGAKQLTCHEIPDDAAMIAQAYAGHQFGHFTMLGDGRALLLGEQITPSGNRVDIHLKGAGKTPYSRGGDGRAALGPMLREYIISEAMHSLKIPTTRSLAILTTGEAILRETTLPGAILVRIAASHLRVGTFEYAANWGTQKELKILADYAIKRHFHPIDNTENRYVTFLQEVIKKQAELIAKWQLVGFVHGVMNTDNMTISGETIDYGPCAFMDTYDPKTVFSSIDRNGRYAYGNQPYIGGWNLSRFAETLLPLLHENKSQAIDIAQEKLSSYQELYDEYLLTGMRRKLGIFNGETEDQSLINDLLNLMYKFKADYTNTFRSLTYEQLDDFNLFKTDQFSQWYERWQARLTRQLQSKQLSREMMQKHNPVIIPRNHQVEIALEAATEHGDLSKLKQLLNILESPYTYTPEKEVYCAGPDPAAKPYRTFCGT